MGNWPSGKKPKAFFFRGYIVTFLEKTLSQTHVTDFSVSTPYLLLDANPAACKAFCNFSAATALKSFPRYYQLKTFHNNYKLQIILSSLRDSIYSVGVQTIQQQPANIFNTSFKAVINSETLIKVVFPPISPATSNAFPVL